MILLYVLFLLYFNFCFGSLSLAFIHHPLSIFSFSSHFQSPTFCLSLSHPFSVLFNSSHCSLFIFLSDLSLSILYSALRQNVLLAHMHTSFPLTFTSSHPSLSLSCVTPPSLRLSGDNYYTPCEDQFVFKQLNKQGLGLLTFTSRK